MSNDTEMKFRYSYLVRDKHGIISKLTVIEVTNTSYLIKWEKGNTVWKHKSAFANSATYRPEFHIIEELTP